MNEHRTLLVAEREVPLADRERYIAALRDTRARCEAVGVHFWAFANESEGSRYLEFAEAKDVAALDALALDGVTTSRWHSVELR